MAGQDDVADENHTSSPLPQKRVLPARERRESAAKRRASSPITAPKSATTPKKSTTLRSASKTVPSRNNKRKALPEGTPTRRLSTPVTEDGIPTKVIDCKPLPTAYQLQPSKLSAREYQSFADSAVLAASLHRSRLKWLAEGIFEKYWTKPSKRKGTEGLAHNPDLKTMQRLGSCAIIIGPHTFDANIYTARDTVVHRHPVQYPQYPVALQPGFQSYPPTGSQPTNVQARSLVNQVTQAPHAELKQEKPPSSTNVVPPTNTPKVTGIPQAQPPVSPAPQTAAAQPGPDPVIRMLATRAATNPGLKALMKVVASSKASQEQLKLFQSHIDELNTIIRQQQDTQRSSVDSPSNQPEQNLSKPSQLDGTSEDLAQIPHPLPDGKPTQLPSPSPRLPHTPHPGPPPQFQRRQPGKPGSLGHPLSTSPYARFAPPQPKMPVPEPRIKAIVVELTTPASATVPASQDRYLFPEYAVLDTPLSGQGLEMVCSFLVVRKGSDLLQSMERTVSNAPAGGLTRWKANEEYYQPVTMTIRTSHHRILETIARSAKPLGEVQNKMKEIMRSKTRVKDEFLVMRLPREKGMSTEASGGHDREFVDSAVEVDNEAGSGEEDDELKAFYGV